MIPQLTLFTALIVGCFRESAYLELFPDCANDLSHLSAQPGRENHAITPSRPPVPHVAFRDLDAEHFFETERLRAKLEIGGRAVPDTRLVLDRPDRPDFDLHHIRPTRETKGFGPQRNTAEHLPAAFVPMLSAVNPPVGADAANRMCVVAPNAVAVNERALSGAVDEVFDCRDGHDRQFRHSRCDPNACVRSPLPRFTYGRIRQPA